MTTETPYRSSNPADILSYIPHTLGFWPRESLVCITVTETRIGATLRVDLPRDPTPAEARDFAGQVQDYLSSDSKADSTLICLYTESLWPHPANPPHRLLMESLSAVLASSGVPVKNAWLVSSSHWREYFCEDAACCPLPGRPTDEITTSELNAELIFRGSHYARDLQEAVGIGPRLRFGSNASVEGNRSAIEGSMGDSWLDADQFAVTMTAWCVAVNEHQDQPGRAGRLPSGVPDEESAGFLLASLSCRTVRDFLLVQICLGVGAALEAALCSDSLGQPTGSPQVPQMLRNGRPPAAGMEGIVVDDFLTAAQEQLPAEGDPAEFAAVLTGEHDGLLDWKRLTRAADLFHLMLQFSSGTSAAALLTMLAWTEWARGRGSRAQCYLDKCLEMDPEYRLAVLLQQLFATGRLPRWARSPATAWHDTTAEAA